MKRILVPVDFSECSMNAVDVALAIARKTGAELLFLHFQGDESGDAGTPAQDVSKVQARMETMVKKAEDGRLKARRILTLTRMEEWIANELATLRVDLVVMGTHSSRPLAGRIMGSTTLKFIRHTDVPVLVVKKKANKFSIRRIAFMSDFRTDWIKPFQAVIDLASGWKAAMHMVYICTPYHFVSTRRIEGDIRRFMHQFRGVDYSSHIYNAVSEEEGVHEFVDEKDIDVVAVTTHGRTGLSHMLHYSIAEEIVKHEEVPVLIINIKKLI